MVRVFTNHINQNTMTSGFALTYLSLQEHLQNEMPELVWIDQDLGQLETGDQRPAISFPAVLIDFDSVQYSNLSQYVQWVDFNISIRLAFAPYASANNHAPTASKEHALEYYDVEERLYIALAGFTANDTIQPLVRVRAVTERREDTYRVRHIIFTTAAEDRTAQLPINMTQAQLQIANEIQNT
jgi:hypothetical protein